MELCALCFSSLPLVPLSVQVLGVDFGGAEHVKGLRRLLAAADKRRLSGAPESADEGRSACFDCVVRYLASGDRSTKLADSKANRFAELAVFKLKTGGCALIAEGTCGAPHIAMTSLNLHLFHGDHGHPVGCWEVPLADGSWCECGEKPELRKVTNIGVMCMHPHRYSLTDFRAELAKLSFIHGNPCHKLKTAEDRARLGANWEERRRKAQHERLAARYAEERAQMAAYLLTAPTEDAKAEMEEEEMDRWQMAEVDATGEDSGEGEAELDGWNSEGGEGLAHKTEAESGAEWMEHQEEDEEQKE